MLHGFDIILSGIFLHHVFHSSTPPFPIFFSDYSVARLWISKREIYIRRIVLLKRILCYVMHRATRLTSNDVETVTLIKLKSPFIAGNVILSYAAYYICAQTRDNVRDKALTPLVRPDVRLNYTSYWNFHSLQVLSVFCRPVLTNLSTV